MNRSAHEIIDTALTLLYESKWNLRKREKAFTMLRDVFDDSQMGVIKRGYLSGLPKSHLKRIMYPGFTWQQMLMIEEELHQLSSDEIQPLINPSLNIPQMQIIAKGIHSGLSADQLDYLIQHKHSLTIMKIILGAFENGVTEDELVHTFYHGMNNQE